MIQLPAPTEEVARWRRRADQGFCPFCDAGPFRKVVCHTALVHGIEAEEFRALLFVPRGASYLSPESLAAHRRSARNLPSTAREHASGAAISRGIRASAARRTWNPSPAILASQRVRQSRRRDMLPWITELRDSGRTWEQIAAITGVPTRTLDNWRRLLGVYPQLSDRQKALYASAAASSRAFERALAAESRIRILRDEGMSWTAIARFLRIERGTMNQWRVWLGIEDAALTSSRWR